MKQTIISASSAANDRALGALSFSLTPTYIMSSMKTLVVATILTLISSFLVSAQSMFDRVNDFDGDGKADYAVIRNENGQNIWYLQRSMAGFAGVAWGLPGDRITAGDYDGDGRTDIAVTRLSSNANGWVVTTYYLASSNGSLGTLQIEVPNAIGAVGVMNEDWDGDGITDLGLFQWHAIGGLSYRKSSTGTLAGVTMSWFQVRAGDVIGNGAADVVSTNPTSGETTIRNAAQGGQLIIAYGTTGDVFIPADFDGDNSGELTVFRPTTGQWWSMRLSDFTLAVRHWGINGDVPVPADYDGDGKTDLAIYRPGSPQSTYYVLGSTAGFSVLGFGISTDTPVTY